MIIESLGVYLPERLVATADVLKACRAVPAALFQRLTGIARRPVVGPAEYAIDLARRAVDRCLRLSRCARETIDLVICCNISRYDGPHQSTTFEPSTAARLCAEFGMAAADAFDVSNACAGTFTGLLLARTAFAAGAARRALIVSGEHITHLADTARREIRSLADPRMACLTLGDSGVAILVESEGRAGVGFEALDLFSMGQYSDLCTGLLTDRPHGGAIMLTQSRKLTAVALEHCLPHALDTLLSHGWKPSEVDTFILHQTAKLTLDKALVKLNRQWRRPWLRKDNFVFNVADRGNLATNSHFVALYDRARQGRLQNGQRVVFSVAASGLTAGTALYALDDLPDRLRQKLNGYAPPPEILPRGNLVWTPKTRLRITGAEVLDGSRDRAGVVDMGAAVARQCLTGAELSTQDIDVLIYCGIYRDRCLSEPAVAAMIAGELGFAPAAGPAASQFAFDLADGAVGFFKACHCAAQMIDAGQARRALIVAAEFQGDPAVVNHGARAIANGAAAALVERSNDHRSGLESFGWQLFGEHRALRTSSCLRTNGSTFLSVAQSPNYDEAADRCAAAAIEQLMQSKPGRIDWCLPLGLNGPRLTAALSGLGLSAERVIAPSLPDSDPFTCAFAHGWRTIERSGELLPGQRVLALQVAAGMRVACLTYVV